MQGQLAPAEVRASSPAGFGTESQYSEEEREANRRKLISARHAGVSKVLILKINFDIILLSDHFKEKTE